MQPKLTKPQIEYIFYHLNHHFDFNYEIKKRIVFDRSALSNSPNIFFPLSDESYSLEKNIEDCTILFPLSR